MKITHVGTATVLIEHRGVRLLTDPAFDPAGTGYSFGFGARSKKTKAPALSAEQVGDVDVALISHDQHADNLDPSGRAWLSRAKHVITTRPGARRLKHGAIGLDDWETVEVAGLTFTATPARHGPSRYWPGVGKVIGFFFDRTWISGDTVWFSGIEEIGRRLRGQVDRAIVHGGGVRFPAIPLFGSVKYTFDAAGFVRACEAVDPQSIVPVHYDGWTHFREPPEAIRAALECSAVGNRVRWIEPGAPTEL